MHALLVTESHHGNTAQVADAVAEGLEAAGARVTRRTAADPQPMPADVDLLVLAAPTHNLGLSTPASRTKAGSPHPERGVREWLATTTLPQGVRAMALSTVVASRMSGSAARKARPLLRRAGATVLGAEDFTVEGSRGPLVPGELERARHVGASLATDAPLPRAHAQATEGLPRPGRGLSWALLALVLLAAVVAAAWWLWSPSSHAVSLLAQLPVIGRMQG